MTRDGTKIERSEMTTGLYFEDLAVGDAFVSQGRTITEADVVGFSGLSGDFNPIHLDAEASAKGVYGQRIAHGILGVAIATGLMDSLGIFRFSMAAMLDIDKWVFRGPLYVGDTIHLEVLISSHRLTKRADRGVVSRDMKLVNQRGEVAQEGVITSMILCRETLESGGKS